MSTLILIEIRGVIPNDIRHFDRPFQWNNFLNFKFVVLDHFRKKCRARMQPELNELFYSGVARLIFHFHYYSLKVGDDFAFV